MQDRTQRKILNALLLFLKPLARAMLAAGIGYREFAEISKAAFVSVATSDYGLRGRPTNISRVAVMTGLTRKEVRRIRDKADAGDEATVSKSNPMAEILHRWYTDSGFLDDRGRPAELPFDDGGEKSFSGLVRKYGGDIPPGAMRTELKRISAIEDTSDGSLRLLKRGVSGGSAGDRLFGGLRHVMYPAGLGLARNAVVSKDETWIHRSASSRYIRKEDVPRLKRICTERLIEFTESIDDLFAAYENIYESEKSTTEGHAVGVGVFYFEEPPGPSGIHGQDDS